MRVDLCLVVITLISLSRIHLLDLAYRTHVEDEKKKLLTFSTGSERVPAGGLLKLRFIIVKQVCIKQKAK